MVAIVHIAINDHGIMFFRGSVGDILQELSLILLAHLLSSVGSRESTAE